MSRETEVLNNEDSEEHLIEVEEAQWETERAENGRRLRRYMIELAGGIADLPLIEGVLHKALKAYKEQILDGQECETAVTAACHQIFENKNLMLAHSQTKTLLTLYFKSIGFMPEIWVNGYDVAFPNIEL